MISAFVLIEAEPSAITELAKSNAEIVTDGIAKQAGVRSTRTLIAFRSHSAGDLEASVEGFGD